MAARTLVSRDYDEFSARLGTPSDRPCPDLVVPIVIEQFRYRVLPFWSPALAHAVIWIHSQTLGVCHLLEFGCYHPRLRGREAVRTYQLPAPHFAPDGSLRLNSFADVLHTIAGLEAGLPLRGRLLELPAGAAEPAVAVAREWAFQPPRYSPFYNSCMAFVSELLVSLGDASARPRSAWIRSWHISKRGRPFTYHPKLRKLELSTTVMGADLRVPSQE